MVASWVTGVAQVKGRSGMMEFLAKYAAPFYYLMGVVWVALAFVAGPEIITDRPISWVTKFLTALVFVLLGLMVLVGHASDKVRKRDIAAFMSHQRHGRLWLYQSSQMALSAGVRRSSVEQQPRQDLGLQDRPRE